MTRNEMLDALEYSIEWLDRYWKSDPHVETSTAYKAYKYVELAAKAYIDISKNVKEDSNELQTIDGNTHKNEYSRGCPSCNDT